MTTPVYYSAPMYTTSGYSTPMQTYYTVPQQQVFYQPVQQRRGLIWPLSTALAAASSPGLHDPWLYHVRVRKHGLCDPWLHNSGLYAHHILLLQYAVRNRSGEHSLGRYDGAGRYDSCL